MQTPTLELTVALADRSYPILIGPGLLDARSTLDERIPGRDLVLISNSIVAPLYAERFKASLPGRRFVEVVLPDGEQHKSLATASRVFDVLVANRVARDAVIVALGGGVVGDLAGFVAACYQRGIALVQVPTTLLAQVDSSVGGKTAVNHPGAKNMIGAFHQPAAVLADTDTLQTLAPRELRAGLAEIIKYGLIQDAAFFAWLEDNLGALLERSAPALTHAIHRSCQIKAEMVGRDEREHGERALLNLGHTFGHAIESATGYVDWLHGEAVGTGMLIAADMSARMQVIEPQVVERLRRLLERAGLPVEAPRIGAARALDYMKVDKKVQSGRIRLILLQRLGQAVITGDYPDDALQSTLSAHFG
ncbi:MAG TPA: 3-dehydroquinate synthase [Steroidobacteraceae bacterium]|nr:3-dehydroquinate synthase [Steroidobacteraceae bacterium]